MEMCFLLLNRLYVNGYSFNGLWNLRVYIEDTMIYRNTRCHVQPSTIILNTTCQNIVQHIIM